MPVWATNESGKTTDARINIGPAGGPSEGRGGQGCYCCKYSNNNRQSTTDRDCRIKTSDFYYPIPSDRLFMYAAVDIFFKIFQANEWVEWIGQCFILSGGLTSALKLRHTSWALFTCKYDL